jgi:hypothetical protein
VCSRYFCRLADRSYRAGDELTLAHDRIGALATAARRQAARRARRNHRPCSAAAALAEENDVTFAVLEATCPYCGKPVAVLVQHSAALMAPESPGTFR